MRLALLIFLLSVCSVAHAVPLLVAAAGALSTAGVIAATTAAIFSLAVIAAQTVYGISKARSDRRKARNEYNANLKDQLTTSIETDSSTRYVYGETRVGSNIVAMLTSGDKDQYKHLVCVHAAHECESIEEIYINGKALGTLDVDGAVTSGDFYKEKVRQKTDTFDRSDGNVLTLSRPTFAQILWVYSVDTNPSAETGNSEDHFYTVDGNEITVTDPPPDNGTTVYFVTYTYVDPQPSIRVKKHLGTPGEAADASLIAEVPSKWTSNHKLSGLCYTVVRLDLNEPEFQGGPPSVEVLLRGAKLYDPRTETTVWSDNPALAAYHYLTSEMCGIPAADLPVAKFITAANVCDESFSFGKRYTLNGAVSADQSQADVLEDMAEAMAGTIVATTWDIAAGKYVAPVMSLVTDSAEGYGDVVGFLAITPGVAKTDLFNGVRGQYLGSDVGHIVTDFKPYQNSAYVTADGGELWMDKTFPFTNNTRRVHNLARIQAEQLRSSYTVKAEFSLKAWKLKVGDRVTLSSDVFGWTDKIFIVLSKRYSPTSTVELTLKEDAASIWDFADDVSADATPNTDLPNPYAIDPIASLTCASGSDHLLLMGDGTIVSRLHVSWPVATTQAVFTNGMIEVEFQGRHDEAWRKAQVTGDETEIYLSPVKDGHAYTVRARTVNPYMNVKSEWHYTFHTVVGKTEAPPDVTGFDVTQLSDATRRFSFDTDNQPVDVSSGGGYRIKYRTAGSGTTWENMTLLHNGLVTASPYETMLPAAGTYDFAIAAVDSSGNESENAALDSTVIITEDSDGSEALALLADLANDNILTKNEKPRLILEVNELLDEFVENRVQADNFSVSRVDYDKKFWALYDYLGTLAPSYDNLAADTVIVGATLRQKFADLYLARQIMLNAIATEAAERATWSSVTGSGRPSDNATSDLKLVVGSGTATVSGNVAEKPSGNSSAWDTDVYSLDSYTGGAYASAIPATTNKAMMFGLNSDPTTDANYTSIDYAFYLRNDGNIGIYESGTSRGTFGSYTVNDVFAITYDGVNVRYMKNGAVIRTVAAAANLNLFFDSSFSNVGGKLTNLRFGPIVAGATFGVNIGGSITTGNVGTYISTGALGTTQLADEAVSSVIHATAVDQQFTYTLDIQNIEELKSVALSTNGYPVAIDAFCNVAVTYNPAAPVQRIDFTIDRGDGNWASQNASFTGDPSSNTGVPMSDGSGGGVVMLSAVDPSSVVGASSYKLKLVCWGTDPSAGANTTIKVSGISIKIREYRR